MPESDPLCKRTYPVIYVKYVYLITGYYGYVFPKAEWCLTGASQGCRAEGLHRQAYVLSVARIRN